MSTFHQFTPHHPTLAHQPCYLPSHTCTSDCLCLLSDELGISLDLELSNITPGLDRPKIKEEEQRGGKQVVSAGMDTDDLQQRLDSLKRDDDD